MTFKDYVKLFGEYQRNIQGRSENTIRHYELDILQFSDMAGLTELHATKQQAEKFISDLANQGKSASTRARKLSALTMFYKWCCGNDYTDLNPFEYISKPKIPHKEVLAMGSDEVRQVIEAARNARKGNDYFRNLTLVTLLFSTGLRRNEVINIKLDDVNIQENSLLVREGKGDKQRIVYFNDEAKALLSEYMARHRNILKYAENSDYLFVSEKSEKLALCTVNYVINKMLTDAGLKDKGYVVHSTRKAYATMVYDNTKDIIAVQNLLGHSSPSVTMRYIGINEESKKQAAMAVNF